MRGGRTSIAVLLVGASILVSGCSGPAHPEDGGSVEAETTLSAALRAHADGRLDRAVDLYERVLVLDPQNKFAYYNLGLIDQTRGLGTEAATKYEQALSIDQRFAPAMFNLAILRSEQGDVEEALALYRGVITVNPGDARAHLNLGFLLIDDGERKQGLSELQAAVGLDPSLDSRIPGDLRVG